MAVVFVYRPFTVVSVAQNRHLWRAGYAERCPSGSEGGSWKRARKSNALAIYPIVEVTDSSSVSPIQSDFDVKSLFSFSTFPMLINYISGFQHSLPNTLISSAVDTCGFLDTILWIDQ